MGAIKGLGMWVGGALLALVLMYMFGAGRNNAASIVFVGYIIWWIVQMFGLSTQAARLGWDVGNLSSAPAIIAEMFRRLKPLYLTITAILLVDSIINTKLGQNWVTFAASIVAGLYLLRRQDNRNEAGNLLRGGRANVADDTTQQRTTGPQGRYANIPQHDEVVDAGEPVQRMVVTAAPEESEYERWAKTASPEDLEAVRLQAERNEQEERAQKPRSRYAHLKDEEV